MSKLIRFPMLLKLRNRIRTHIYEILNTKHSPHSIALGFSLGTFISILPTPGLNFALGFILLLLFKNISKYSLFASLLVWNTVTLAPMYVLSYKLGNVLFGSASVVMYDLSFFEKVFSFSRRFLVGNFLIAILTAVILYFIIWGFANLYNKKKGRN
jgi:uncharacterized protein